MKSSVISARVVVGCNGTPASDAALRFAAEEARLRHARLIVVAAYYRRFATKHAGISAWGACVAAAR